jgi:brefeldin A-resistance guanine nucleotide exchange factor 1
MASLGRQSINSSREIRQVAITHLQRVLLGQYILLEDADQTRVEEAFNRVVFPLVDELLKPEVFNRDPAGMPETRLRAASLLCKAFMQLEVKEGENQTDIRVVWIQVLDLLDRLMNIDRQDQLVRIRILQDSQSVIYNLIPARSHSRDTKERHSRHERGWTARPTVGA